MTKPAASPFKVCLFSHAHFQYLAESSAFNFSYFPGKFPNSSFCEINLYFFLFPSKNNGINRGTLASPCQFLTSSPFLIQMVCRADHLKRNVSTPRLVIVAKQLNALDSRIYPPSDRQDGLLIISYGIKMFRWYTLNRQNMTL